MIILSIDVTKIDKAKIVVGKKQRAGGTVGKYLELVVMEHREGEDAYGNTHMVVQGVSKEDRQAGVKGAILGNGKEWGQPQQRPAQQPQRPQGAMKHHVDPSDLDTTGDEIAF